MGRLPPVITLVIALACVLTAVASATPRELMPGLTYDQQVAFTSHGPVVAHVLIAPRPGGLWGLKPVLSNETILGHEKVTAMQKRASAVATVAGVNGDFFNVKDGHPSGILMRNGALDHPPIADRSSAGIDSSGTLRIDRVSLLSTWQGSGPRRTLADVNGPAVANGASLFTPAWGTVTPAAPGSVEVVLSPFVPAAPNVELAGPVSQVLGSGGTPIPPGGAVLVARGAAAARLQAEAPAGQQVRIRLILKPDWAGVVDALGGGPVLVRAGGAVFSSDEQFNVGQLFPRRPRSAVGQTADGRILLVAVDGDQPGYSAGMTNFELALAMVRLGAVTAFALDSGGSTTMAFEGQLLSRPSNSGGTERAVAESLLVTYVGVYAPAPREEVLSPNGDGVAERQQLSFKVVRPSTVTVSLLGPDGAARYSFSGPVQPGTYPLDWSGLRADGSPEPEGRWHWTVSAADDLARASSIDRGFWLNNTLAAAKPVPPTLAVPRKAPRAVATVTLARAATVTTRIETTSGVVLKTLERRRAAAGPLEVAWDGTADNGAVVYSGRYVARVLAENDFGPVGLAATFSVRRLPPPPPPKPKPKKPTAPK